MILDKILRPGRKLSDQFILAAILSIAIVILAQIIGAAVKLLLPVRTWIAGISYDDGMAAFLTDYFDFAPIWITVILVLVVTKSGRRMLKGLLYNRSGNNITGLLMGLLLGFATNGLCILISWIKGDIMLSYQGFDPLPMLIFLIAVFIQSGAEELTDRFYLYQKLRRRYRSPAIAIIWNSIVFASMHLANPGITYIGIAQILLVGIVFSLLVYYYDALWMAMAFHCSWNYTQNIIFGLPNSGIVSSFSMFKLEAASARNGFFYNIGFGVEGSIGACLVLTAVLAVILLLNWGKGEKRDLWAETDYASKH